MADYIDADGVLCYERNPTKRRKSRMTEERISMSPLLKARLEWVRSQEIAKGGKGHAVAMARIQRGLLHLGIAEYRRLGSLPLRDA